jgi:hypothetical protein
MTSYEEDTGPTKTFTPGGYECPKKFKSRRQSLPQPTTGFVLTKQSGRQDSNLRLRGPKPRALARLSYAPFAQKRLARFSQDFEQPLEIIVGIEGQNDLTLLFTLQTDFDPG